MTESEIIDKVYRDIIEQEAIVLFRELMNDDQHNDWHQKAELRFSVALKAAAVARERAKALIVK